MKDIIERAVSLAVGLAAIAIAVVLVHREFFSSPQAPATAPALPEYVANWSELQSAGRLIGDSTAPVKVIEFADLECPFCRQFHTTLNDIGKRFDTKVAFVYVHLPLPNHRFARPAARAVECAHEEGRFAALVDRLYQGQDSLGLKSWSSYAAEAGIRDTLRFQHCLSDTSALPYVERGVAAAEKHGISATPTVIVNGWKFPKPPAIDELDAVIQQLLDGKHPFPKLASK